MPPPQELVRQNLIRLRKRRGWSQRRLALESGVHLQTIVKIETGQTTMPKVTTLERLASVMGLRFFSFFIVDEALSTEQHRDAGFEKESPTLAKNNPS